jgi:hypothetical protein
MQLKIVELKRHDLVAQEYASSLALLSDLRKVREVQIDFSLKHEYNGRPNARVFLVGH